MSGEPRRRGTVSILIGGAIAAFAVVGFAAAAIFAASGMSEQARIIGLEGEVSTIADGLAGRLEAAHAAATRLQAEDASLEAELSVEEATPPAPYIVVGVADRALVLRKGKATTFQAKAGVGKGQEVLDGELYSFETPAGLYHISAKEEAPVWLAPDWHYLELAKKLNVDTVPLTRAHPILLRDGSRVEMAGDTATHCTGEICVPYAAGEVIVVDKHMVVPPGSSIQRRYLGVLGTHRLKLGGSYAIHGTDKPGSVGRASSHGCIRLRNEDVDRLYEMVDVGTAVLIY